MTDLLEHRLGALRTPPEILAKAWPIRFALAALGAPESPPAVSVGRFHSPKCALNTTIDQDGVGACVAFSGAYIQADQELADEGKQLNPGVLDPLRTYFEVKGIPYAGWGTPDPSPGLYPVQLFDYLRRVGWATKDGSRRRKIESYGSLGQPSGSIAWFALYKQVIDTLGPCQIITAWPHNWYGTDSTGHLAAPSSVLDGAHAWEACGGELFADGAIDVFGHQTWGLFGHDPDYPNHFRMRGPHLTQHGWESWKATDVIGDAPIPPVPVEDLVTITDKIPMLVDLPLGRQLFKPDGKTVLTPMRIAASGVYSPAGGPTTAQRYVVINTGGVLQQLVVNVSGLTFRPFMGDVKHNWALTEDGVVLWSGTR